MQEKKRNLLVSRREKKLIIISRYRIETAVAADTLSARRRGTRSVCQEMNAKADPSSSRVAIKGLNVL